MNYMKLIPVETPQDFLVAQQFIASYEETCVSLASLVRRKSENLLFIKNENQIAGILNLDSTIYHCIPNINLIDSSAFLENLLGFLKKPVRCISGETAATNFLISVFKQKNFAACKELKDQTANYPAQIYPYRMMRWADKCSAALPCASLQPIMQLSGGEEIIRCTEHDLEILHSLQKDYMKDEVAVPGRTVTHTEVDITLRQILKNQLCLAFTVDGEIVAKANTNAIGIKCVQIGGVYTHPLYRRNGYAGALVQTLCNRARKAGKMPVLFVKEKNTPAFNLYQKLGFEECGRYTIAYY